MQKKKRKEKFDEINKEIEMYSKDVIHTQTHIGNISDLLVTKERLKNSKIEQMTGLNVHLNELTGEKEYPGNYICGDDILHIPVISTTQVNVTVNVPERIKNAQVNQNNIDYRYQSWHCDETPKIMPHEDSIVFTFNIDLITIRKYYNDVNETLDLYRRWFARAWVVYSGDLYNKEEIAIVRENISKVNDEIIELEGAINISIDTLYNKRDEEKEIINKVNQYLEKLKLFGKEWYNFNDLSLIESIKNFLI